MTKTIMIIAIAAAFVAGSILTGTMAYAAGDNNGKPFEALWDAIHNIELTPGEQGEQGIQGIQGEQGDPGNDGEDGTNGEDGSDGTNGTNGEDGADGEDGAPGEGGSQTLDYTQRSISLRESNPRGTVFCPAGYIATGFGVSEAESHLFRAEPSFTGAGYSFEAAFDTENARITAYVNCVNLQ